MVNLNIHLLDTAIWILIVSYGKVQTKRFNYALWRHAIF
jgi:hypothetical protein